MAETKVIPKVGFYALLLALALAPFLGGNPAGAEYNSDASLGALRILVLVAALASQTHPLAPSLRAGKRNVALWFAVAWSALSLLIHSKFFTSPSLLFAQIPAVLDLLCAALVFSLATKSDEGQRQKISIALIVGLGLHALMAAQQYGTAKQAGQDWFRATGLFFSPNFSAGFIGLLLPLAFVLCLLAKERLVTLGFGLASALGFGALIASGSRVGLAAAGLGLLVALLFSIKQIPWQRLGVLLLACLALGFGFKGAIVSRADKTGGQTTTKRGLVDEFRLYTWRGTAKMALANPVFGTGPGTFPALYPRYAEVGRTGLAHQSYLQVAAENGIPTALGLLTAALLALASVRRGNLVCAALAGGLLAALVRSCFDSEWALQGNSLPFWTVAGLLAPPINPLREAGEGRRLSGGERLAAALGLLFALLSQAGIFPAQPKALAESGKLAEAAAIDPTPRWQFMIARRAEQAGDYATAIAAFQKARVADPNDLQTLRALAETQEKAGDKDGAKVTWQQLVRVVEGPAGKIRAIPEVTGIHQAFAYAALEQWDKCADTIVAHSFTDPVYQLQAYNVLDNSLEKARTRHTELIALFETTMSHLPERNAEKTETLTRLEKFFQ
ncbi:MAG: O-antigen ligase family protein [Armatimonadetes bacterium]|nr:O-antigen ligase family protein [Armatimonadota bacterium]